MSSAAAAEGLGAACYIYLVTRQRQGLMGASSWFLPWGCEQGSIKLCLSLFPLNREQKGGGLSRSKADFLPAAFPEQMSSAYRKTPRASLGNRCSWGRGSLICPNGLTSLSSVSIKPYMLCLTHSDEFCIPRRTGSWNCTHYWGLVDISRLSLRDLRGD